MDWITTLVTLTEIVGTIAFSISGAVVAIRKQMDILGVIVLGVVTAVGGGVIRDVLLGLTPPTAFIKSVYVTWATVAAIVVFLIANRKSSGRNHQWWDTFLNVADAVGLGIFAVMGVRTALANGYGDNAFLSIFLGVLTGVGGGLLRDTMAREVPKIFRKRIYAVAAWLGAAMYYYTIGMGLAEAAAIILSSAAVVVIRMLATHYEWNLPRARYGDECTLTRKDTKPAEKKDAMK